MNSKDLKILLVEGTSDIAFLSLLLQKWSSFQYLPKGNSLFRPIALSKETYSWYENENSVLLICSVNGCGDKFNQFFNFHIKGLLGSYEHDLSLTVITDCDNKSIPDIINELNFEGINFENDKVVYNQYKNEFAQTIQISSLLEVIPKEKQGTLENVIMEAISIDGDKQIVDVSCDFIDSLNNDEKKYILSTRLMIKAKLGVVFNLIKPDSTFWELKNKFSTIDCNSDVIIKSYGFLKKI